MILLSFKKPSKSGTLENWTLLLFSIAWANQVMIVLVYWIKLYPLHLLRPEWVHTRLYWWHNFNKHFTPLFAFTLIFLTSKKIQFRLTKSIAVFFFFSAIFNCIVNAYGQYARGDAIYYFTDWEKDPVKAFSIINVVALGNMVFFYVFGEIS